MLAFLQEPPPTPDTTDGLIIGYVVMGAIGLAYLASLFIRRRNYRRDLEVIDKLQNSDE